MLLVSNKTQRGGEVMNTCLLKATIALEGLKMTEFFKKLNEKKPIMTASAFYKKLRGETEFTREEIQAISEVLSLTDEQLLSIFFWRLSVLKDT